MKALTLQVSGLSFYLSVTETRKAKSCKVDFANLIFASIFKKAKLPLTSKAGGLRGSCGLRPHVKCFSGKCGGQVGKQIFSRMLMICPCLGILGGTARIKNLEIFLGTQTFFIFE